METSITKSGFVSIIGLPNSGKSTLVNAFIGTKMSIVSHKAQTTRQRIFSIYTSADTQVVFSDTPGWIDQARYPLQHIMNNNVDESKTDADVILIVVDTTQKLQLSKNLLDDLIFIEAPKLLVANKIDRISEYMLDQILLPIKEQIKHDEFFAVSALNGIGVDALKNRILEHIPVHPPYFPEDISSDRPIRFFISELIREQIYYLFEDEIPYSTFVHVTACKGVDDQAPMAVISAIVYTNKQSQIPILLGKGGIKIKQLGIKAREEIEKFLNQKVYLDLSVKLKKDWRDNTEYIEKTGILR
ncbi:MAG: GTPase Era [Saprospiraceae bacterium]|uniref:GTPase Era n=1 Tax=Candidatus Defluviibacterium haderslevense TaxID=2981993 RepID=A0A9D7SCS2_9BACT|nr:GTPase Era [Candidatus Defluviibacterium haderslevense]MBL0237988.1 GTPase Era [Candidatus Defluviibacterium haderslevense]